MRCSTQKELLLQVAEQKDSVEKEISMHKAVSHRNVVQLVDSQVVWRTEEVKGKAFLLFPFYQVPTHRVLALKLRMVIIFSTLTARHSSRRN